MQPIPLIRAATVAGIADALDAHGLSADRMLERARIPLSLRENLIEFVPGRSVWTFASEISRRGGPPDFLAGIASLGEWRRSRWVPPLAHAATLGDALRRMCVSWVREIPMVRMGLTASPPVVWFWRLRVPNVRGWDGNEPAEQYTFSYMLEVVRAAAGPDWRPARVKLESSPCGWGASSPFLAGTSKQYDQPLLALAIPRPVLALPVSIEPPASFGPTGEASGEDFESSLRQVLRTLLVDGPTSQDVLAGILGMSGRSLRRRLAEEGTSWRSVVQDVKFSRAAERLFEGRTPIRQVAEELGFSDAANFTRFFCARTGVAPSRWQGHIESVRARLATEEGRRGRI